jgi:hypothetical protein
VSSPVPELAPDLEPDLQEALTVGNQAASKRLGALEPSPGGEGFTVDGSSEVRSLADRVAMGLRVAPLDPDRSARLVDLVSSSGLSEARRAMILMRLEGDRALADQVAAAMARRMGEDDPALRSALIAALEVAGSTSSAPGQVGASDWLSERVAAEAGADRGAVRGLVQDLALLVAFVWDEDEEELAPPGDYAAEESGF